MDYNHFREDPPPGGIPSPSDDSSIGCALRLTNVSPLTLLIGLPIPMAMRLAFMSATAGGKGAIIEPHGSFASVKAKRLGTTQATEFNVHDARNVCPVRDLTRPERDHSTLCLMEAVSDGVGSTYP